MIGNYSKEAFDPPDITIKRVKPAEISDDDYYKLGLVELVALGYGYTGTPEYLLEQAKIEYDGDDKEDRFDIFLALINDKVIGSLSTTNWSPTDLNRGQYFWRNLQDIDPLLSQRAYKFSPYAFEVGGIVTHPEFRNQKIARKLIHEATTVLKPAFVFGQTKTPEAVITRANPLRKLGYRTFFGEIEISTDPTDNPTFSPTTIINAHLAVRDKKLDDWGLVYVNTDLLLPTIPDISNFPQNISRAFNNIIEGQKRLKDTQTAVKPLISVYKEIINN